METVTTKAGAVYLRLHVQPKASRNAVSLESDGRLKVALTAPPVEGAANKALVAFMADILGLPKRQVSLEKGEKSREKILKIVGIEAETLHQRLGC